MLDTLMPRGEQVIRQDVYYILMKRNTVHTQIHTP